MKESELSRLTAPDDEDSDTIQDHFQAYSSAVAEYIGVCHESQTHDKTNGRRKASQPLVSRPVSKSGLVYSAVPGEYHIERGLDHSSSCGERWQGLSVR